jgi:membrane glycosyltransferase
MVMIGGSYEEFPPTIIDMAIRDRRWMQGNLQHLQLLGASGLHWASRLHLLIGASAYLTSPGWLLLILTMIGQVATHGDGGFVTLAPPSVLALTVMLLFGPKIMGLIWVLADGERRRSFGGGFAAVRSVLLETVLAMLLAPITMVTQTKALLGLLLGISAGWNTQTRDARRITVREVLPDLREHLLLGAGLTATAFLDLFLSPWLISLSSSENLGDKADAAKVFRVPEPGIVEASEDPRKEAAILTEGQSLVEA